MALKDHIIDSSKVAEEQVEAIIDGKIKYDSKNQDIVLLPEAKGLSNDKKILVYLAALRGWPFLVKENTPLEDASPMEITYGTGIPGGSVRPLLRALEDRKMVTVKKGRYHLPSHNFATVSAILAGKNLSPGRVSTAKASVHKEKKASKKQNGKRAARGNKPTLAEGFTELLADSWFKGGKNINQLKEKLDEMTVFPPLSQLPWHLLKAYRDGRLTRLKESRGGKKVWIYYQ
jgi:hypothetical protein